MPPERCSAPKTASGMAKHKWVRATILSMPRAWAISFFAANSPITSSARPAADIEQGGAREFKEYGENSWLHGPPEPVQRLSFYDEIRFKTALAALSYVAGPQCSRFFTHRSCEVGIAMPTGRDARPEHPKCDARFTGLNRT